MDLSTLRRALSSMAYREQPPGVWLKPVGWQTLCFVELRMQLFNHFKGMDGQVHTWQVLTLKEGEDPLTFLKDGESHTRLDMWSAASSFELPPLDHCPQEQL